MSVPEGAFIAPAALSVAGAYLFGNACREKQAFGTRPIKFRLTLGISKAGLSNSSPAWVREESPGNAQTDIVLTKTSETRVLQGFTEVTRPGVCWPVM